jgi:hypothetical protein
MHDLATANGVNVDLELALFDADHGDPEGALAAARAEWARRQSVHVADAYAWALYANGRYQRASTFASAPSRSGPGSALFLFHAGMIRLELGDEAARAGTFRGALATNPNFSILHATTRLGPLAAGAATPGGGTMRRPLRRCAALGCGRRRPVGSGHAIAHPLGNFTVNRYAGIELTPGEVRIEYVLDMPRSRPSRSARRSTPTPTAPSPIPNAPAGPPALGSSSSPT